jgi:CRP-like cAMP-binding protein
MRMRSRQSKSDPLSLLAAVPLFRGCSKSELKQIDQASTMAEFPAGSVMCKQGQSGHELMVVVAGTARVEIDGNEVNQLGAGEFIGELSLLDGGPRSATVTAIDDVRALVLAPREFSQLLRDVPTIGIKLLATLASRFRSVEAAAHRH